MKRFAVMIDTIPDALKPEFARRVIEMVTPLLGA
jgi:hypothetical protein